MLNKDVPGVIGQVGTILGAYEVNIGEWRMGRNSPGEEALSFINLDCEPPKAALDALEKCLAITKLKLVTLCSSVPLLRMSGESQRKSERAKLRARCSVGRWSEGSACLLP